MQSCELVELAALATAHGPVLLASGGRLSSSALEQYWASSKCRLDRWSRALRQFLSATHRPDPDAAVAWTSLRGELEEILTGEILTRVWMPSSPITIGSTASARLNRSRVAYCSATWKRGIARSLCSSRDKGSLRKPRLL